MSQLAERGSEVGATTEEDGMGMEGADRETRAGWSGQEGARLGEQAKWAGRSCQRAGESVS